MSTEPSRPGVPIGPLIASVGAVMLITSLFLDWYDKITGFTVFEFLDLLLVLLALATIASLAGGLGLVRPAPSRGVSLAVAIFTVYVVVPETVTPLTVKLTCCPEAPVKVTSALWPGVTVVIR